MIIQSVAMRTPSKLITNDWIIEKIQNQNSAHPDRLVTNYCRLINRLLNKSGAKTRYIRDREKGERAFDLLLDAARSAISDSGIDKEGIDLIIYCGVGRGFLEPSNAAFLAHALGTECDNFDVNEACMSWVRSLHLAYNFLTTNTYSRILIVNAEFTFYEHGPPKAFELQSGDQLAYTYPALTIGEAATATIAVSSDREWKFRFRSIPTLAPLCHLPLPGYCDFCEPDFRVGLNGPHQLVAFGSEMSRVASREMISFVREHYSASDNIDLWIPHNTSEAEVRSMDLGLGLNGKLFAGIFHSYGNLISASIPAAIVVAQKTGSLERGQRIVLCPATAGMAFGLVEGAY